MGGEVDGQSVFFTFVQSEEEERCAFLLSESLRSFGGRFSGSPFWVFHANPLRRPLADWGEVSAFPLTVPDSVAGYELAGKVCACARAEKQAGHATHSLVWLSPEYLILKPPLFFSLSSDFDAAFRPVHIRNVGSLASQPPDAYWRGVYDAAGTAENGEPVESFVDGQRLRPYFNTHGFAVAPEKGLLREWLSLFESLVCDDAFQKETCADPLHRIFLHQATLSALLSARVPKKKLSFLPPTYNYPYNLQREIPEERRVHCLNDLVGVVYEERLMHPELMDDIKIEEPLTSWLANRIEKQRAY